MGDGRAWAQSNKVNALRYLINFPRNTFDELRNRKVPLIFGRFHSAVLNKLLPSNFIN